MERRAMMLKLTSYTFCVCENGTVSCSLFLFSSIYQQTTSTANEKIQRHSKDFLFICLKMLFSNTCWSLVRKILFQITVSALGITVIRCYSGGNLISPIGTLIYLFYFEKIIFSTNGYRVVCKECVGCDGKRDVLSLDVVVVHITCAGWKWEQALGHFHTVIYTCKFSSGISPTPDNNKNLKVI